MKVRLLKDNGMEKAKAGDIIEASPAHGDFLICYGWAEKVTDAGEQAEAPKNAEEPKAEVKQVKPEEKKQVKPAKPAAKKK